MIKKRLSDLTIGEEAIVKKIKSEENIKRRILDIGVIPNSKIKCVLISPSGNPKAFLIKGTVMAIRNEDSKNIIIGDIK